MMSTVPPGPHPQSASPVAPSSTPKKVGTSGYWIALAIFLLGCGAAIVWFIVTIMAAINAPNDFARTSIPGSMTVELSTGEWVVYHEADGINDLGSFRFDPLVEVTGPDG